MVNPAEFDRFSVNLLMLLRSWWNVVECGAQIAILCPVRGIYLVCECQALHEIEQQSWHSKDMAEISFQVCQLRQKTILWTQIWWWFMMILVSQTWHLTFTKRPKLEPQQCQQSQEGTSLMNWLAFTDFLLLFISKYKVWRAARLWTKCGNWWSDQASQTYDDQWSINEPLIPV